MERRLLRAFSCKRLASLTRGLLVNLRHLACSRLRRRTSVGLAYDVVEAIFREHSYSPITGDVLLIGRQTVYLTPEELLELAQSHGTGRSVRVEDIEIDSSTIGRRHTHADATLVHDRAIFKLLGNERVKALDHTHYEGAEVVHNLNTPVPENLKGCADFIVDGSTLDNVFSPSLTIRNYVDLLR